MTRPNSTIKANKAVDLNFNGYPHNTNSENNNSHQESKIKKAKPNSQAKRPTSETTNIKNQSDEKPISEKLLDDAMLKGF